MVGIAASLRTSQLTVRIRYLRALLGANTEHALISAPGRAVNPGTCPYFMVMSIWFVFQHISQAIFLLVTNESVTPLSTITAT